MTSVPIRKSAIIPRIQGIQEDLLVLQKTAKMALKDFESGPYFGDANFRFHRVLEGVFNMGNYILARLPGASKGMTHYVDTLSGESSLHAGKHGLPTLRGCAEASPPNGMLGVGGMQASEHQKKPLREKGLWVLKWVRFKE